MTNLNDYLPYLMRRMLARIADGIAPELADIGINHERWRVLTVLHQLGALPLNELANHVSINTSTLSRLIDRMIREELIDRAPSGVGRAVAISLAAKGEEKLEAITPMVESISDVALNELGEEGVERLRSDLRRLYDAFDHYAADRAAYTNARFKKPLSPAG